MSVTPFKRKVRRTSNNPRAGVDAVSLVNHRRTEFGLAERLLRDHQRDLRYWPEQQVWLVYDGTRWAEDRGTHVERLAKQTIRGLGREATEIEDQEERKKHLRFAEKSETARTIMGTITAARSECEQVNIDTLDADGMLLNVLNGTIDLRTGQCKPHDRSDLITKLAPVAHDPEAACPTWIWFLERIFDRDQELIGFVQRMLGHCLTGDMSEQAFFVAHGKGANGKSTLLNTVASLLGDYSSEAPADTFASRRTSSPGGASPEIARLRGARFVTSIESEAGRGLNEALIKSITGQDRLTARRLHRDFFEFTPQCKVILATNHKPEIKSADHGIQRRIRLVPFNVTIPVEERDPQLQNKLRGELPGILNWLIEGCLSWQREGLGWPQAVQEATQDYLADNDQLIDFINARCETHPEANTPAKLLQAAYRSWCEAEQAEPLSQKRFGLLLGQRDGIVKKHSKTGKVYVGIGLKPV